ncbi:MAG TPA: DUF4340 domain-containing protein [Anaerohalosphaeraceae bacterium]|nr:DUF4340 domain-containing protein [Anaerohalosphaeraceae bacterium]HPO69596.1 DUF4340 domain-containing protein [Anaerohalosphaeraceae bacterium]
MSDRKLAILGIAALIMLGGAILQSHMGRKVNTAVFSSSPLVEGLPIEAVSAVTITSEKGTQTVRLQKKDNVFVVAAKDNYPADVSKINTLISHCLDIRTREKITSDPANHADLKVTPETARYVIAFQDKDGKDIVGLAVSESDENGNSFARLLNSDDVYTVSDVPWIDTSVMGYINTKLLEVQQDKVSSVAVRTPEDTYVLAAAEEGGEIRLENMPQGKQYKGTTYKTVFNALSYLRFDDVMAAEKAPADLDFNSVYTCKLKDLTVYKVQLAKQGDKTYAKVSADYLDKTEVTKTVGQVESEEELKKKEAKLLAIDAVNAFNQKHQGWIYVIPSYKSGDLSKPLAELIEDIPTKPQAAESDAAEKAADMPADPNAAA